MRKSVKRVYEANRLFDYSEIESNGAKKFVKKNDHKKARRAAKAEVKRNIREWS